MEMKNKTFRMVVLAVLLGFFSASENKINAAAKESHPPGTKGGPMILIPAGEFGMGCNAQMDSSCYENEKPYHKIYLDAYDIDKYEVTQTEYGQCVSAGKCKDNKKVEGFSGDHQPVMGVNWEDAEGYCQWAGKRLPTEAEWEKAARGTDGRIYPWGNQASNCNLANISGCGSATKAVGSYPSGASPYGVMDLAGNVWEWVNDRYDRYYYANSPSRNPSGPSSGSTMVLRGGSWDYNAKLLRASARGAEFSGGRSFSLGYGFRCARGG